jgi:hypothetical protein
MSPNSKPRKQRKCRLCREPLNLGDARCEACGGPAESRNGGGRWGGVVFPSPRVFPGLQRLELTKALASGKVVLCETCGWRQANLKPAATA